MKNHILLFVVISISLLIIITNEFDIGGQYYDCGMAEWHPDIPKEVKEECRRIRYEERKKQIEQRQITI